MPSTQEPQQVPLDGRLPWWPYSKHLSQNLLKEVSSFLILFPFSHVVLPSPWKHLKDYFDSYRQNHILSHAEEINPMCLQNLRYKVVAKGWPSTRPWKVGLLQPLAGAHALHRHSWSWHGSTQHTAWRAVAVPSCSSSRGPEEQWLKPFHVLSPTQVTSTTTIYFGLK